MRSTQSRLISEDHVLAGVDEDKLMKELGIGKDGDVDSVHRYYKYHKLRSKLDPKARKAKKARLGSGDLVSSRLDREHNKTARLDGEHHKSHKLDSEHHRTRSASNASKSEKNITMPPTAEWLQLKKTGFIASASKTNSEPRLH